MSTGSTIKITFDCAGDEVFGDILKGYHKTRLTAKKWKRIDERKELCAAMAWIAGECNTRDLLFHGKVGEVHCMVRMKLSLARMYHIMEEFAGGRKHFYGPGRDITCKQDAK